MAANRKNRSSVILRLAIFAVAVYMIVTLCGLWGQLVSKQSEYNRLKEQRDKINNDIQGMLTLLEGDESAIIEKAARERLGYVYADEQVYIDNSGN